MQSVPTRDIPLVSMTDGRKLADYHDCTLRSCYIIQDVRVCRIEVCSVFDS